MRRHLLLVLVGMTSVIVLAFVVPLALLVRDVARDRAMADADRDASALLPAPAVDESITAIELAAARTEAGTEGRLTIYLPDGTVIGPERPITEQVTLARTEGRAWSGELDGVMELVVPVVHGDGGVDVIRIVIPSSEMEKGVRAAWLSLAIVGAALSMASVVFAYRVTRSVTAPVAELADAAQHLASGNLESRVVPAGPPEIAEAGRSFNYLAEQVSELLAAEREDVADLAHRLRTPLAALRLQLEQIEDDEVRTLLADSADDLARSLDRVISEARRKVDATNSRFDLVVALRERFGFWLPLAEEQGRDVHLDIKVESAPVRLGEMRLRDSLDVVFENVFSHTPEGVGYTVSVASIGHGIRLEFVDDGPGIAVEAATERGVTTSSSGLGLDIARRAVEAAGGSLHTTNRPEGGARIVMQFPVD